MKYEVKEMELSEVISTACGVFADLADELQEAYDNTPENIQNSAVGEARQEAADALSSLDQPSVHESIEATKIKVSIPVRSPSASAKLSRSSRRDDAVMLLQNALDQLSEQPEPHYAHVDQLIEELDQLIGEVEAIDFPGRNA
jgi:hypothetical protein